jgi:hypothetical protein
MAMSHFEAVILRHGLPFARWSRKGLPATFRDKEIAQSSQTLARTQLISCVNTGHEPYGFLLRSFFPGGSGVSG